MTRPNTLRPAAELAAGRSHGDRLRYIAGCRCDECRRANTEYEKRRAIARKSGDWNGYVPAGAAREHLAALSAKGVGYKQAADAAGVAISIAAKILNGQRQQIRARTERSILAVTSQAVADRALIDAGATWKAIDQLLAQGYSKAHLARELGYASPAIQLDRTLVTARNAYDVEQLHRRLLRVPARGFQRLLALMREEGYRPDRIARMVGDLAAQSGQPAPDMAIYDGFVSARAEELLQRLHAELVEESA